MTDREQSWYFFQETGLPEAYLLYAATKKKDDRLVHTNQGSRHTRDPLQGKR